MNPARSHRWSTCSRIPVLGDGDEWLLRDLELEFFWHDATKAFGYSIEVITAGPMLNGLFDTVAAGPRDWDGRDPVRILS